MSDPGLEDLVRRAKAGDRDAANALVARVVDPVRGAIRRRLPRDLRRRVGTDDIFQSAISDAIAGLDRFEYRGEEEFLHWVGALAEQRIVEAARRHRAQKRDVKRDAGLTAAAEVPARATSPTEGAVRGEAVVELRAAIARLPDAERRAVELRSLEECTFDEIARRMDLTDKFAARRLYLAGLDRLSRSMPRE